MEVFPFIPKMADFFNTFLIDIFCCCALSACEDSKSLAELEQHPKIFKTEEEECRTRKRLLLSACSPEDYFFSFII
jgi:hypothetical protein